MTATTATLHGYGRVDWAELVTALAHAATAWADYDGFHIGQCPDRSPPYTHLWAWTPGWLLRARVDGADAIVAALLTDRGASTGLPPVVEEQVEYQIREGRTWPEGELRVGPIPADVADRTSRLYHVVGDRPITFVRLL